MLPQKRVIVFLAILVVFTSVSFALAEETKGSGTLAKATDALTCKIDFTVTILDAYATHVNATNLSSEKEALTKDKALLQELAAAGNVSAVREFVKNVLDVDLRSAKKSVDGIRSTTHKSLTKEQKQGLKDAYKKAQDVFKECHRAGLKNLGEKRVEEFTKILDQHALIADRFAAKGLDASSMKKVVEDARAQVVTPLKDALAKANSSDEIQAAVLKYCLFNGCKNGVNFHFAAKFEMERLSATLAYLKSRNLSVSDDVVSKAEGAVTSARGLLAEMGTTPYMDEGRSVKSNIRAAYGHLKNVRVKATRMQGVKEIPVKRGASG